VSNVTVRRREEKNWKRGRTEKWKMENGRWKRRRGEL
jgi:hypothetical protein